MSTLMHDNDQRPLLFDDDIDIRAGRVYLGATLTLPQNAAGLVLFAHGSGSSRFSPRNKAVAAALNAAGLATILLDLLTAREDEADRHSADFRFNVRMLGARLAHATDWVSEDEELASLNIGYFGASTGAAAALIAAAARPDMVRAVVSRGGRPDLASDEALQQVRCPTLLIVGELDLEVLRLNKEAFAGMECEKKLSIVPGATHLFEEQGALQHVSRLATSWFIEHLAPHPGHMTRQPSG